MSLPAAMPQTGRFFFRVRHGGYAIHPQLQLRYQASQPWQPLVQMLNYPLLMESASNWQEIHRIAQQAGFEVPDCPVFAERELAARSKALMEQQKVQQEQLAHAERLREQQLRQWQAQREQQAKNNQTKEKLRSAQQSAQAQALAEVAASLANELPENELPAPCAANDPPWGTPAAKALALARLAQRNAALKREADS